jgi:hypothetical protein
MPVTNIPDEHHVVRHCRKKLTIRENGVVIGIHPAAFHFRPANPPLRPKAEDYLSTVYFEFFNGQPDQLKLCSRALAFQLKPNDAMARLNVGLLKAPFNDKNIKIRVTHEGGGKHHPAYSAIRPGMLNDLLCSIVATTAIVEVKEVKSL